MNVVKSITAREVYVEFGRPLDVIELMFYSHVI